MPIINHGWYVGRWSVHMARKYWITLINTNLNALSTDALFCDLTSNQAIDFGFDTFIAKLVWFYDRIVDTRLINIGFPFYSDWAFIINQNQSFEDIYQNVMHSDFISVLPFVVHTEESQVLQLQIIMERKSLRKYPIKRYVCYGLRYFEVSFKHEVCGQVWVSPTSDLIYWHIFWNMPIELSYWVQAFASQVPDEIRLKCCDVPRVFFILGVLPSFVTMD